MKSPVLEKLRPKSRIDRNTRVIFIERIDRHCPKESPLAYALQQFINGLTLGMIYGLIAVGYTMVYGIIGMINFAHGDIFMIGAFIAIIALTAVSGFAPLPLGLLAALILSAGLCAV